MKTTLFFIAMIFLAPNINFGQVLFQEDFETDFQTNGWQADLAWEIGTATNLSSTDFVIPAHTRFAAVNDDAAGQGVSSFGRIVTKEIDLTNVSESLIFSFDAYFIDGDFDADETAKLLISIDDGLTWQGLIDLTGSNTWQPKYFNLGANFSGEKIRFAFEYDDNNGWNYGFCVDNVVLEVTPDYLAFVSLPFVQEFSISTPYQLEAQPLRFIHKIENYGNLPLEGITLTVDALIAGQGLVGSSTKQVDVPVNGVLLDTIFFKPTLPGKHSFNLSASHPVLGDDFYQKTLLNAFEISDSTMAKDDGQRNVSIGMSFGSPNWYGYYGSEFALPAADTLTGISVWMTTSTAGSFNLTVNALEDGTGPPTEEIFHSPPIKIAAGFNNWVYYPLP